MIILISMYSKMHSILYHFPRIFARLGFFANLGFCIFFDGLSFKNNILIDVIDKESCITEYDEQNYIPWTCQRIKVHAIQNERWKAKENPIDFQYIIHCVFLPFIKSYSIFNSGLKIELFFIILYIPQSIT